MWRETRASNRGVEREKVLVQILDWNVGGREGRRGVQRGREVGRVCSGEKRRGNQR